MKKNVSKKTLLVLATGLLTLSYVGVLAACDNNSSDSSSAGEKVPEVKKLLKIVTPPKKTVFTVGDAFDLSGMVVKYFIETDGVSDEGITLDATQYQLSIAEGTVFTKEDIANDKEILISYKEDSGVIGATLHIVVKDYETYSVVFENDDGTVLDSTSVKEDKTVAYEGDYPSKEAEGETSYFFDGWYVKGDPEKKLIDLATYKITKDTVLVAHYIAGSSVASDGVLDYKAIEGKGYAVVGFHENADKTKIDIPATINNQPIIEVAEEAFEYESDVTSVTMSDNIVRVGASAFYGVENAISLHLSNNLASVGEEAFRGMSKVTSLEIPGTLKEIPKRAFSGMESCASLTLHEGIETIRDEAFSEMPITYVSIPDSVKEIVGTKSTSYFEENEKYDGCPFQDCKLLVKIHLGAGISDINEGDFNYSCASLQTWEVSENNPYLVAKDGILYSKDMTTLLSLPCMWAIENADGEVDKEKTATFVVPDSVTTIGRRAMMGWNSSTSYITKIVVGKNVRTVQSSAFYQRKNCDIDFSNNNMLEEIGYRAFAYMDGIKNLELPESTKVVGDEAFYNCENLESVVFGKAMTHFGENMFKYCEKKPTVSFPKDADYFMDGELIYNKAKTVALYFNGDRSNPSKTDIVIPNTVTEIADNFLNGVAITSLTLGKAVQKIGDFAFADTGITSLTLPSSVTEVGESAFEGCSDVATLLISDNLEKIGANAFSGLSDAQIDKVTIKEDATVGEKAFYRLGLLKEVDYKAKVLPISCFEGCSSLKTVALSDEITELPDNAFADATELATINIPSKLAKVGTDVFSSNRGITNLTLPNTLTSVADNAFEEMEGLMTINVPSSVTSFGEGVFSGDSALANVIFEAKLEGLPVDTFYGCSALKTIALPNTLTFVGDEAFKNSGLETLTLSNAVTELGNSAFENAKSLTQFTGEGVNKLGTKAFAGCTKLTQVALSDKLEVLSSQVFKGCSSLEEVVLPTSLKTIGTSAFNGSGITSFTLPNGVNFAENNYATFQDCLSLTTVDLKGAVTHLDGYFFSGDSSLATVNGLENVTELDSNVFKGCSSLENKNLSLDLSKLTSIGSYAFSGCTSLTEAPISTNSNYTEIEYNTYEGMTGLVSVTIPSNVTLLHDNVFDGCTNLTSLTILGDTLDCDAWWSNYGFLTGTKVSEVTWANGTMEQAKALFTYDKTGLEEGKKISVKCKDGTVDITITAGE